ncbi:MAG TPA: hypothetical protein VL588_04480 [Bdellovibrionota bacterium]|jgi:hypothetical protein|nr:hypothetical protein [Bdellovibrionota bacterium]
MKLATLTSFALALGLSTAASAGLPETMTCDGIKALEGVPAFMVISDYLPATIHPGMATVEFEGPFVEVESGTTSLTYHPDGDGDQYSIYRFATADLDAFAAGKKPTVEGTFEDGFDWSNGYNVRAKFSIKCHR